MMINPMMYRVFLRDEKDTPDPCDNPANTFRIQEGEINAWYHNCPPGYKPSLDEQLEKMHCGGTRIGPLPEKIDGFDVISMEGYPLGIVTPDADPAKTDAKLADRCYGITVQHARELAADMSRETGHKYIFIDVTSRGDRKTAEGLAAIVVHETVDAPSPRSADVGD
jgi:hypothetical protein